MCYLMYADNLIPINELYNIYLYLLTIMRANAKLNLNWFFYNFYFIIFPNLLYKYNIEKSNCIFKLESTYNYFNK